MLSFGWTKERRARLKAYRAKRSALEALSDRDLSDMGINRYQLGHLARIDALK